LLQLLGWLYTSPLDGIVEDMGVEEMGANRGWCGGFGELKINL